MTFQWLSTAIPVTNIIMSGIQKIIGRKGKIKEIETVVNQSVVSVYNKQYAATNRDIALIRSYKPITAKIQAIDITIRQWEFFCTFCILNESEDLINKVINKEKIKVLISLANEIQVLMGKISKESTINWSEGGISLIASLSNLIDNLNDLKTDYDKKDNRASRLEDDLRDAQEQTKEFFIFWDEILKDLVYQAANASKKFLDSLPATLKDQIKLIKSDYPTENWMQIVQQTLIEIKDLDTEK